MSKFGSLPNFLIGVSIFNESPRITTQSQGYEYSKSTCSSPRRKTMGSSEFHKLVAEKMTLEARPEGYKYISERKDIENCIRSRLTTITDESSKKRQKARSINIKKPVKSRISCRRDPPEIEVGIQKTVKMQEKIRNELLMKNNHFIMRSMRKNLRDDEKKTDDSFCESNNLFHRLVQKVLDCNAQPQAMKYKKNADNEKVVQKHSEAMEKTVRAENQAWMKKRGNVDEYKGKNTGKMIFEMLDPDGRGDIPVEILVKFLLEIGLALNPQRVKDALQVILKKDYMDFKLKYEDINSLCKGDHKTNLILKCLNDEVRAERLSKSEGIRIDTSIISVGEHLSVLNNWWNIIDKHSRNQVTVNITAEFLAYKNIVGDSHEGRKLIKDIINSDLQFIDKDQFQIIFVKSMIRWILINIHKKFSIEDWNEPNYSPAYKITSLKRNLIMAGIKCPKPGVSQEEGIQVINAIEKYRKYSGSPNKKINYDEFSEYWTQKMIKKNEKPENKNKLDLIKNSSDCERPWSVPSLRLEVENNFFKEFQKFVNT
ncbi:hypothetical protein SteCoe_20070 [Stentor coeruleus]|uniref:EF-hand domain-containing protein n=1 Tax=Stentor coeruleus TaxID=5963 RepID=A0A1R2BSZ3_9CILI|nr:hypothetical protein SteCoe_20070 [Stentor coeruleus]